MATSLPSEDDASGGIVAEINITPLTDVFLVLLIIFMVTSSVIANTGKSVDLPEAAEASTTPPQAVNVTMAADGTVEVNGRAIQLENLRGHLEAVLAEAEDKMVILRGDKTVVLERAVYVLDQAQLAGAEGFAIATTRVKER
ncbi:MAG: biopolymer transporter ExbD [Myxococcota bacterium]|nr:biopolymer transporter ExbD [Myxococcota bacterium]